jgi:exonuclease III
MEEVNLSYKILSWNVRGLNNRAKQEDVSLTVSMLKPDLICIQETKTEVMTPSIMQSAFGPEFESNFFSLPADGSRGGIILAVNSSLLQLPDPVLFGHSISAKVFDLRFNRSWVVTGVYGPQGDLEKKMFIRELKQLK